MLRVALQVGSLYFFLAVTLFVCLFVCLIVSLLCLFGCLFLCLGVFVCISILKHT